MMITALLLFFFFVLDNNSAQIICDEVRVESNKTIRKLPRVQHLCARLSGRLKSEEDEVDPPR